MSRRATPADSSARWCVDLRTAQRWHAGRGKHHPPPAALTAGASGDAAMLAWYVSLPSATQAKLSRPFRAELTRLRIAHERGAPAGAPPASAFGDTAPPDTATSHPAPPHAQTPHHGASGAAHSHSHSHSAAVADPDYLAFLAAHPEAAPTTTDTGTTAFIASLRHRRAFAAYKLHLSQRRGDIASLKDAQEALKIISSILYDEEMLASRLSRDLGESLPRPEAQRLLRALAYWTLRGADDLLATLCPLLARASAAPLYPEEIRALLEPHLLAARLLAPYTRAAQLNAGTTLPPWAIDTLRAALAATLEDGEKLFNDLYATPVPVPTPPIQPNQRVTETLSGPPPEACAAPSVSDSQTPPTAEETK